MDLKDVISIVTDQVTEAQKAYNAGHPDNSEKHLATCMLTIGKYLDEKTTPAGDVTEAATSEKPAETLKETQAKVSGPGVHPAVIDPAAAALAPGVVQPFEKQTQ